VAWQIGNASVCVPHPNRPKWLFQCSIVTERQNKRPHHAADDASCMLGKSRPHRHLFASPDRTKEPDLKEKTTRCFLLPGGRMDDAGGPWTEEPCTMMHRHQWFGCSALHSLVVNHETNLLSLVSPWLNKVCQIQMKRATMSRLQNVLQCPDCKNLQSKQCLGWPATNYRKENRIGSHSPGRSVPSTGIKSSHF
jgi:hypothetical protein